MVQDVQVYAAVLGTHSYNELSYNGNMLDSVLGFMRDEREENAALARVSPREL
eukprot:CAMPEP_0174697402 /NCGR_PEP_ID=MMETSP1094-20130205/3279_1 /TAXON_ID=156173 /ORGANISM="Chrysochromulina brevifilum, Strain UTEX LB 985" /LENGTH=52 /DNA_ID=CAMNT_0015894371 /DNA_START=1 /DNA_END=159 /DNA_ORIENTATION=-